MDRLADRFHVLAYRARLAYRTGDTRLGDTLTREAQAILCLMTAMREGVRS